MPMIAILSPSDDPQRSEPSNRRRPRSCQFSPEGLERLRAAAKATRPWERSCGPRTAAGKARSAQNGRLRQKGEKSVRELRAELASLFTLIHEMDATRRLVAVGRAWTPGPAISKSRSRSQDGRIA